MVNGGKVPRKLFIFNIVGVYVSLVHSYFNAEEIYGVTYGFEISSEPVLLKESPDLGNTLLLSSKHGQQYQCVLPQLENLLEKKNDENQHITKDEIPQLLEPMKKKCLFNNKGWWTYEVCFGKGIYQYHKEGQEVVGDKITLGVFSNETDWSQEKIAMKEKPKPGKHNVVKRYHSQYYVNGSKCDLTGKARETQIKIYCDEGIADVVLRVDEPSSCSYVITVHTNKLCHHSLFKPNPSQKPQAITCSPALSEERYKIYIERIESRKRAKEEAEAAKYQAEKARAAKKIESEDELIEQDEEESSTKKKRSKRSQVWPWENPGVESEDEVWIDGNIKPDEIGVHRLDITKGRKKNANGVQESEGITIMSQKMQRKRDLEDQRQKGDSEGNLEEMSEHEEGQEQTEQTEKTVETENIEGAGSNEEEAEEDKEATEQNNEQESKEKQATSEEDEKENDIQSSATLNGASAKIEKETGEAEQGLDDEWKAKMEEAVLKLRSTLKEKLVKLGIKPEVLDQKFKESLGSVAGKGAEKDHTNSHTGTDEEEADKLEEKDSNVLLETDHLEKASTKDAFTRTIEEMKILNEGMMKELMDAASATQAEMEKQFDEERAQMKTAVEHMKTKIKEIEDIEEKNGVKDDQLGETMSKMKDSIERFEKTNMQLDEDMLSAKELNKEIFRTIEDKDDKDLLQLSSKTNKLVKNILLRRFQLEKDLHYIKKMQSKISADEDNARSTDHTELGTTKSGIDQVVNKLKTMIQDLDHTEERTEAGVGTAAEDTVEPGSSTVASAEDSDSASKPGLFDQDDMRTGVKVKVSKIKKVTIPDDDESELEETDLDEEEMEKFKMDKRIRLATKKMEEMVKQELRDSGVVPSGKIRVKIVTSKDALESLDSKSDARLLSDREETQFRDMILGLLGGSPEAGKERKRQQDLENNYNLVWSDDELQTVPREDDDADGEVEVESY